jgi:hypothetical protein
MTATLIEKRKKKVVGKSTSVATPITATPRISHNCPSNLDKISDDFEKSTPSVATPMTATPIRKRQIGK